MYMVVTVFSSVSTIWKTNYCVDFLKIEFFSWLLNLCVAQMVILRSNIIIAHLKIFKAGNQRRLNKADDDARFNDWRLFRFIVLLVC